MRMPANRAFGPSAFPLHCRSMPTARPPSTAMTRCSSAAKSNVASTPDPRLSVLRDRGGQPGEAGLERVGPAGQAHAKVGRRLEEPAWRERHAMPFEHALHEHLGIREPGHSREHDRARRRLRQFEFGVRREELARPCDVLAAAACALAPPVAAAATRPAPPAGQPARCWRCPRRRACAAAVRPSAPGRWPIRTAALPGRRTSSGSTSPPRVRPRRAADRDVVPLAGAPGTHRRGRPRPRAGARRARPPAPQVPRVSADRSDAGRIVRRRDDDESRAGCDGAAHVVQIDAEAVARAPLEPHDDSRPSGAPRRSAGRRSAARSARRRPRRPARPP